MLVCATHKHKPILYAAHGHVKLHVHNNEEMAFDYTEVQVFSSTTRPENVDSVGQMYCRQEKEAVSCGNEALISVPIMC